MGCVVVEEDDRWWKGWKWEKVGSDQVYVKEERMIIMAYFFFFSFLYLFLRDISMGLFISQGSGVERM